MNNIKRLERSRTDRMISGVCGGIARQFNLDTVIVRMLCVVVGLINVGVVAIIYVAAIFLIPEEPETGAANTLHPGWRYDPWTGEPMNTSPNHTMDAAPTLPPVATSNDVSAPDAPASTDSQNTIK